MANKNQKTTNSQSALLWAAAVILGLSTLVLRVAFPEILWAGIASGVLLIGVLAGLIQQNIQTLRSRTAAFGAQSAVTIILVVGIVGILNFLVSQHPIKWDLTKNKMHTLSGDTVKLMKGLKSPVKATLFAKMAQREQMRPVLDNYKALNPTKFEIDYVDPDKEPMKVKQFGIKKYGTLQLQIQGRESRIEEVSEEKLTNAMIKLLKDKTATLCVVSGHGERNFSGTENEGYSAVKKGLEDQSYTVMEINLVQDAKTISSCDAVAIVGPNKSFFDPEIKTFRDYLASGGRALIALDLNIKGTPYAPELDAVLGEWHMKRIAALVVDPFAQVLGGDAAMPRLVKYASDNPITREFREKSFAPFLQPLEVIPGAPADVKVSWLAQTDPQSWGITDLATLKKGSVAGKTAKDKPGPLNAALFVDGKPKESKATRNTRMVVFGSSYFATNNFARFGGNQDLLLNSVSWLLEDENFISIHAKEEGPGRVDLGEHEARAIGLVNVIILPFLIAVAGVVIWFRRRRL